ncbi:straight fibre tail protein [Salmonella phage S133]|uniref:Central straight fiber n=2 Tax=Epseptimavirus TaxID=2732017 RepID=A0A2Z5HQL2_9CAUD|nr:straight fibre tail protein [Salmonella phage S114]YP_009805746.1 straight fibre tail protein [Salmonella phage S133]AXC40205.1 central straight fiber [Salmonella phage S114]AXC41937.1 central straight fiber [Salmonella phage S133]EDV1300536.1 phage tail protein [Salmonella enterica subsp. enterica serovar Hadar]
MISNNAPAKMVLNSIMTGYTMAYIQHSIYTDYDVIGRSFWLKLGEEVDRRDFTGIDTFFVMINNLTPSTTYQVQGAFYDSIIDSELLNAKIGINLSNETNFKTKEKPIIVAAKSESEPVDVGVGAPIVVVETTGEASYCTIELKSTATEDSPWTKYYIGALGSTIKFGGVPIGDYKIRISGQVTMPDGVTVDSSGYYEFPNILTVAYNFVPPTAPINIVFKAARIADGKERYDVRIEWDWERGAGANVREFLVTYINSEEYAKTGWAKAQKINVGAARAATIISFPWKVGHTFKVSSIAWGPNKQDITESAPVTFILNEDTPLDNSFVNETGIDVNYAFIKGSMKDGEIWRQTFLIDAATGAINIGLLDGEGKAPISFDPINRVVNVDGKVITRDINAANFIMTNLSGKDNPAIYTQGKSWGDNNSGIWMGMDNTSAKAKLDIGNATQWIRYDGTTLRISSGVVIGTPNGDVDIGTGLQGKQTVFVYKLATSLPAKPLEQDYPPPGWSKTPPNRTDMTQNIYTTTGTLDPVTNKLLEGTSWSDVVQWSGTEGTIGHDGQRGPGMYSMGIPGLGGWDDGQANAFFQNNFGKPPVKYDVLTQFNSNAPQTAFTRQWNGSGWINPAMVLHGNMIVNGTVTADKIVAGNAFLSQIGVNIIYDRNAALSGNPEAYYKMKIDLNSGYIHIR